MAACHTDRPIGWIGYVVAWVLTALFWTLAGASSSGRPVLDTLPFGLLAMGAAGTMAAGSPWQAGWWAAMGFRDHKAGA
jgi:hypothetical protein